MGAPSRDNVFLKCFALLIRDLPTTSLDSAALLGESEETELGRTWLDLSQVVIEW